METDILITFIFTTVVLGILVIFFISFFRIYQNTQFKNIQEKANLKAQFEQEILNAENEIQDATMKHISRELHDNVGQMLTLVKIQLNNLAEEAPENKKINDSKEFISHAISDIRSLSKTLNSDHILLEGLEKAIEFELSRVKKLENFEVDLHSNLCQHTLDSKKEILIFRIFQELLQNCLKHSKAKKISVNLEQSNQCLNLELVDDGIGFDFEEKLNQNYLNKGSGLLNLKHRVNLMNGTLTFKKTSGVGTVAQITIPL